MVRGPAHKSSVGIFLTILSPKLCCKYRVSSFELKDSSVMLHIDCKH